jgi:hypothetical protein
MITPPEVIAENGENRPDDPMRLAAKDTLKSYSAGSDQPADVSSQQAVHTPIAFFKKIRSDQKPAGIELFLLAGDASGL